MRSKRAITILLATMFCCSSALPTAAEIQLSEKMVGVFNEGATLYSESKWEQAAEKYAQVCREVPDFEPAHEFLGYCFMNQEKKEEAIQELLKAEALKTPEPTLLLNLAALYQHIGKINECLGQYRRYLELYPKGEQAEKIKESIQVLETEAARSAAVPSSKGKDNYLDEAMQMGACRWKSSAMPLGVFIGPATGVERYESRFGETLQRSFKDWSVASDGAVTFKFVPDAQQAQITVTWTGNPKDLVNSGEGGECMPSARTTGEMMAAKLILLTPPPAVVKDESANDYMRRISLHEIGHALGLNGHSTQSCDIMFYTKSSTSTLSERDKKTLALLYKAPDSFLAEHPLVNKNLGVGGHDDNPKNRAVKATGLAIDCANAGDYAKAIEHFEEALKLMPDDAPSAFNVGNAYHAWAIKDSKEHNDESAEAHLNKAVEYMVRGKRKDKAALLCGELANRARRSKRDADAVKYEQLQNEYEGSK